MSLSRLAPRVRQRLRWHGWAIVGVCLAFGWAASALLWRALGVWNMGVRYAVAAGIVYATLLLCLRVWLDWVRRDALAHPDDWRAAEPDDLGAYAREQQSRASSRERSRSMLDWGIELLSFDEAAWFLLVPALVLLVLAVAGFAVQIPLWTTEAVAALLAELLLPLLLGGAVLRGRLRRAPAEVPWADLLASTWWIGLVLIFVAGLVGAGLQAAFPGLVTVRGLLA